MIGIFGLNLRIHWLIIIVHDYNAPGFFTKYFPPIQQHIFSQGALARTGASNEQITAWLCLVHIAVGAVGAVGVIGRLGQSDGQLN